MVKTQGKQMVLVLFQLRKGLHFGALFGLLFFGFQQELIGFHRKSIDFSGIPGPRHLLTGPESTRLDFFFACPARPGTA